MKRTVLGVVLCLLMAFGFAHAAGRGTPEMAKAMMLKAHSFYMEVGQEKAFAEFNNPNGKFVQDDLYIFVLSKEGSVVAHGRNKALIGKSMMGVSDVDGKFFTKEMVEAAFRDISGSVEYKFTNPETKKTEPKVSFYKRAGDVVIGCGAYK